MKGPSERALRETDDEAEDDDVEELDESPTTPPPGSADPTSYSEEQMDKLLVLMRGGPGKRTRLVPLGVSFSHQTLTIEVYRAELIGIGITIRGA